MSPTAARPRQLVMWLMMISAGIGCDGSSTSGPGAVGTQGPPRTVLLLAAASTTDAVTELAAAYEDASGVRVRVSTAGSNALANQIMAGVPGDVYLSANQKWAQAVREEGLAVESSPLLSNRLVLIAPPGNPARVASPDDLLTDRVQHVALAGDKVPAGMYAEQALRHAGVYPSLLKENKVARGKDVRLTLSYVATGEAEAGVVYATDARASRKVEVVHTFPPETHEPIVYPLVLLRSSREAAGRAFYEYLRGPAALAIFRKHGFSSAPPDTEASP